MDPAALGAAAGVQGAGTIGMVLTALCCMVAHRGWLAADVVIDKIENKSVQVVEVLGDHVTTAILIFMGLCITLLFVFVQRQVAKNWAENKKTKALRDGQNLE